MLSIQNNLALFQIHIGFGSVRETSCLGSNQWNLWGRAQIWWNNTLDLLTSVSSNLDPQNQQQALLF